MKLKTLLFGKTYAFRDVKDVLAKANEPKSGDRLAGLAAESAQERVAAKAVLAELLLPFVAVGGRMLCYKGPAAQDELEAGRRAARMLGGGPLEALPVERSLKRAVLHPEADAIRRLALSGGEIAALGLRGEEIGAAQKQLAAHILSCPGDNTRERLLELLEGTGDGCKTL